MATDPRVAQLKALILETAQALEPDLAGQPIPAEKEAVIDLAVANVVKAFDILTSKPQ